MYSSLTDVVGLAAARPQLARATALSKMNALRSVLGTMLCNGNSCVHPSLATSAFHAVSKILHSLLRRGKRAPAHPRSYQTSRLMFVVWTEQFIVMNLTASNCNLGLEKSLHGMSCQVHCSNSSKRKEKTYRVALRDLTTRATRVTTNFTDLPPRKPCFCAFEYSRIGRLIPVGETKSRRRSDWS